MNPFDAMQNLADLWNKGGKAYLTAARAKPSLYQSALRIIHWADPTPICRKAPE